MENERLPHETVWNLSADPFALEARREFRCIFCGGKMEISHGQVFTFELHVHGDAEKWSHACDIWMYCRDCMWSVVHGAAIPEELYVDFANLSLGSQRIDEKGEPLSDEKIMVREKLREKRREDTLAGVYGRKAKRRLVRNMKRYENRKREIEKQKAERLAKRGGQELPMSEDKKLIPPGMAVTLNPIRDLSKEPHESKPRWQETDTVQGLEPLFPMTCKMCERVGEMFLRHSRMHLVRRDRVVKRLKVPFLRSGFELRLSKPMGKTERTPAFRVSYKCPLCDFLATFVPPVREEHFDKILELRNGEPLYYPPLDEWGRQASEDELIKRKLEELGYV